METECCVGQGRPRLALWDAWIPQLEVNIYVSEAEHGVCALEEAHRTAFEAAKGHHEAQQGTSAFQSRLRVEY